MDLARQNIFNFLAQTQGITSVPEAPSIPRPQNLIMEDNGTPPEQSAQDDILFSPPQVSIPPERDATVRHSFNTSAVSRMAEGTSLKSHCVVGMASSADPTRWVTEAARQLGLILQSDAFCRFDGKFGVDGLELDRCSRSLLAFIDEFRVRGVSDPSFSLLFQGVDGLKSASQEFVDNYLRQLVAEEDPYRLAIVMGLLVLELPKPVASSDVWWTVLSKHFNYPNQSESHSISVKGSTTLDFLTEKLPDRKLSLSRFALHPSPEVMRVDVECSPDCSPISIVTLNAVPKTSGSVPIAKKGWAKHATRRSDKSYMAMVSGHVHNNSATIDILPSSEFNPSGMMLCGELRGKITLKASADLAVFRSWNSVLASFSVIGVILSIRTLLMTEEGTNTDPSLSFLLSTGSASGCHVPVDESKLAATLAFCRADVHWKHLLMKLIATVNHMSSDLNGTCSAIRQRWLLHWRPALQGDDNAPVRSRLSSICDFFLENTNVGCLSPSEVLNALFKCLERDVTVELLKGMVQKSSALCSIVAKGFAYLQQLPIALSYPAIAPLLTSADVVSLFAGGPSESLALIRSVVFANICGVLSQNSFQSQALSIKLMRVGAMSQSQLAVSIPTEQWKALIADAHHLPLGGFYNTIVSTEMGVRVSPSPSGDSALEASRMGDISLRASQTWRPASDQGVRYMELTLASDGFKRVSIGLTAPYKPVDTPKRVLSAPFYTTFNDEIHQFHIENGDTIGCGIFGNNVTFTLNGAAFHSEPLSTNKNQLNETFELLPFIFLTTTKSTSFRVNFGEAPFMYNVVDMKGLRSRFLIHALSSKTPLFNCAVSPFLDGTAQMPLCARNALRNNLDAFDDDQLNALANVLKTQKDFGGSLMADLIRNYDFLELNLKEMAQQVVAQETPNDPVDKREFTAVWSEENAQGISISGNSATLTADESCGACYGVALPNAESLSFSISLRSGGADSEQEVLFAGSVYVGVSLVTSLDPIGWKTAEPKQAWAIHKKLSEQLAYADLPPRPLEMPLFNEDSTITVTINRLKGTIAFNCDGDDLGVVFKDVPEGVSLRPFVQLVGAGSSAFATSVTFNATPLDDQIARHHRVALLKSLLVAEPSSSVVAEWMGKQIAAGHFDIPCEVMGSSPDACYCTFQHMNDSAVVSVLQKSSTVSYRVRFPNGVEMDIAPQLLFPLSTFVASQIPSVPPHGTRAGLDSCLVAMSSVIEKWSTVVLSAHMLEAEEASARGLLIQEAMSDLSSVVVLPPQGLGDLWCRNGGLLEAMLSPISSPAVHCFSVTESHPRVSFPSHYGGALMIAPLANTHEGPFIGLGSQAIPSEGQFSIRMVIDREWMGMLPYRFSSLSSQYAVGLATSGFKGEVRLHSRAGAPRDIWSIPAVGTREDTLPYSTLPPLNTRYFNTMDKIRLHINRNKGTMELFVTPLHGAEQSIGVAFTDIPQDISLYPFVQLADARSSALFIPESALLPRSVDNKTQRLKAISKTMANHSCDGCLRGLTSNEVSPPNWYRCNMCGDYDLCHECFASHVHPGHTFSQMKLVAVAPSPLRLQLQPSTCKQQQVAEISALPLRLCKLVGAATMVSPLSIGGRGGRWSGGAWAAFRRSQGKASTEARMRFHMSDSVENVAHPVRVVFGVGLWDALSSLDTPASFAALPYRKVEDGRYATVVSVDSESLYQHASNRNALLSVSSRDVLVVQYTSSLVTLSVNGVSLCSAEVSFGSSPTAVFVSFNCDENITAELFHPNCEIMSGKITEIHGSCVRVSSGANSRWCDISQLREPLSIIETAAALVVGLEVYIVDDVDGYKKCVVTDISQLNDNVVTVDDGLSIFSYGSNRVWVPSAVNTAFREEAGVPFREEKARMRRFYKKYAPEKTEEEMDIAIQKFSVSSIGIEGMFTMLVKKYGPEPEIEILRPIPSSLNSGQTLMGTSFFTTLSRLLFLVARSDVSTSERLRSSLLKITQIARPTKVSTLLMHAPVQKTIALSNHIENVQSISQPEVRSEPVSHVNFSLKASTSHAIAALSLQAGESGSLREGKVMFPVIGPVSASITATLSGLSIVVSSADKDAHEVLRAHLNSQAVANAFRTSDVTEDELFRIEVIGPSCGKGSVFWWSLDGHHGYGDFVGDLQKSSSDASPALCLSISRAPSDTENSLNALSKAAANARAHVVIPGSADASFMDIAIQPEKADRFCVNASDSQMAVLFTEALAEASKGRFIPLLPTISKHYWLRTRDTEISLKPLMKVVHAHWNNVDLLRNLTTFSETVFGDESGLETLRSVMRTLLTPLSRHFDLLARNNVPLHHVRSAAVDAFYSLGMTADHLPLAEICALTTVSDCLSTRTPLPRTPVLQEQWQIVSRNAVVTTSLLRGSQKSILPPVIPAGGVYFEIVQPPSSRVVLTVAAEDGKFISFDGSNARRSGCRWRPFGHIGLRQGDVVGCHVTASAVTFSINMHRYAPIKTRFYPVEVSLALDYSDEPLTVYSTEGSTQFMPRGAVALHSKPARISDVVDRSSVTTNCDVDDSLRSFVTKVLSIALPYVDRSASTSVVRKAVIRLKDVVNETFRRSVLAPLLPLRKGDRQKIPTVSVKWHKLFSPSPRTPEEAIRSTVLSQLHAQLTREAFFEVSPMFVTALSMTESTHTPVDAGGPYMAVWGLISEEIMTTESEKPNFHRNPMFVLTDSKDRKVMVPNRQCVGFDHLYTFLGILMGHMARAKTPLALDFSPFVWKVLVGDDVTVNDYFSDVDVYFKALLEDDELLEDDFHAGESFPGFAERLSEQRDNSLSSRRAAASQCVVRFLDKQLLPMRKGLLKALGEGNVPFMTWRDLERAVCGDPNPTFEQVKESISCNLPEPYQSMFWDALKALEPAQWSQFFSFCSAQKRYPLSKKIMVVADSQASTKHLPVASTCFAQLRLPLYSSKEMFLEQIKKCIVSQEMELA